LGDHLGVTVFGRLQETFIEFNFIGFVHG